MLAALLGPPRCHAITAILLLESFGDLKIGGQVICTVKYADDLVLLAKEETVLQDIPLRAASLRIHRSLILI
jgi:hypothetical protein